MDEFFSDLSRQKLKGGYIVVLHTHGRNGQYSPHLHLIATSGGWDAKAERWVHGCPSQTDVSNSGSPGLSQSFSGCEPKAN
jgi:hypothetical protein